ncbi:MAG: glycosyltransferase family 9 protein, partial [Myxococcaceae bacterium]
VDVPKKFQRLVQQPFITLAPGAGDRAKFWPLENYIQVAKIFESQNIQPVFILGPSEVDWKEQIIKQVPNALFPLQETSETSVYLTIALGQLAELNIANDGGAAHLLALSNQPTIVIYKSIRILKKWHPNGSQVFPLLVQKYNQD